MLHRHTIALFYVIAIIVLFYIIFLVCFLFFHTRRRGVWFCNLYTWNIFGCTRKTIIYFICTHTRTHFHSYSLYSLSIHFIFIEINKRSLISRPTAAAASLSLRWAVRVRRAERCEGGREVPATQLLLGQKHFRAERGGSEVMRNCECIRVWKWF